MRQLSFFCLPVFLVSGVAGCGPPPPAADGVKSEWPYSQDTKYGQVRYLMTPDEVVSLMGCEGKRAESPRDHPADAVYVWKDVDGRETSVVFRDGKAIARFHLDAGTETVEGAPHVKR